MYCSHCYELKEECCCGKGNSIKIDYLIYPAIRELNRKGYKCRNYSAGKFDSSIVGFFVMIMNLDENKIESNLFGYEQKKYKGVIRENLERIQSDRSLDKTFNRLDIDKKKDILININYEFYEWVISLPIKELDENIGEKIFEYEYFLKYKTMKVYQQKLLVINPESTINQYLEKSPNQLRSLPIFIMKDRMLYGKPYNGHNEQETLLRFTLNQNVELLSFDRFATSFVLSAQTWLVNIFDMDCSYYIDKELIERLNKEFYLGHTQIDIMKKLLNEIHSQTKSDVFTVSNGTITLLYLKNEKVSILNEGKMMCITKSEDYYTNINLESIENDYAEMMVFIQNTVFMREVIHD